MPPVTLSLAEELLLIGLDDELGIVRPDERLGPVLAGAWLAELLLLERIAEHNKVLVLDETPTGLEDVDFILRWIADPHRRSLEEWLGIFTEAEPIRRVRARLLEHGLVQRRSGSLPGQASHPVVPGTTKPELRARLHEAVALGPAASPRDACLCRLIETAELGTSLWLGERERMRLEVDRMPGCVVAGVVERRLAQAQRRTAVAVVMGALGIPNYG